MGVLPEEAAYPLAGVLPSILGRKSIDRAQLLCDNSFTMSARKKPPTMSEVIRQAIVESGMPYKALSRETGLTRASIQRFVDERQSLRLDLADRLAEFFGLTLRKG